MPKMTAFKLMTKAEQAAYLASMPKPPPLPRPTPVVRVAEGAAKDPEPKDGLAWLVKKKKLNRAQQLEAMRFRAGFRDDDDGASTRSCLNISVGRGSIGAGPEAVIVAQSDARREYLYICSRVLAGQPDLVAVMDGVCGHGWTVRHLAGGNQLRQAELETALKIALDLIIAWRADLTKAA